MSLPRLAALAVLTSAVAAYAGPTILLDDYDNDDSDEFFGDFGLLAIGGSNPLPILTVDTNVVTGTDVGRIRYIDSDVSGGFATALYPNDAFASLELDLPANDFVGFELVLGNRTNLGDRTEFPVGFRLLDDGPTSATRLSASFDALVPGGTGEFVVSAMLSDFQFIDDGFEFDDIRQITWGLNAQNAVFGLDSQSPTVQVDVLEFRAIIPEPASAGLVVGACGFLLRRTRR